MAQALLLELILYLTQTKGFNHFSLKSITMEVAGVGRVVYVFMAA